MLPDGICDSCGAPAQSAASERDESGGAQERPAEGGQKQWSAAWSLCLVPFLGSDLLRFYTGRVPEGILTLVFWPILLLLWPIDIVKMRKGKFADKDGRPLEGDPSAF